MSDLVITSAANPRLKALAGLRRRRIREESGTTLLEGYDELRLALDSGVDPLELYYCPELMAGTSAEQATLDEVRTRGAKLARLSRSAFEKVAYREGPDGFLAVVRLRPTTLDELTGRYGDGRPPFLLLCQGIEKPGNLGAMLRTADAAGVDAVVAVDPLTDWGNPNVVRASKGTVFSVPVISASTEEVLRWCRDAKVSVLSATPDTTVEHTDVDYTGPVAIAVGTEKDGLTEEFMARSDERIRIPMVGKANSLNVATSAAILVYEAVRQRSAE